MNSISRRTLGAGLLGTAALGMPYVARGEAKITLKLGHLANEQDPWHKACLRFAEEIAKRTGGQIEVKVFPNESLGHETDLIKGIQLGTVDFTITGESLQNWAPAAALLGVPYALRDTGHIDRVVAGPIGKAIDKNIEEKTGLKTLCYFARGPRELTSNRPIRKPADLGGFRMRVPNVPLFVAFWAALGAKPTPMAFSEVFTSLQNNTIEGQENPLALIKSASFFEVQKCLNRTNHSVSWIYLVGGTKRLAKLTAAQQKAIVESAKAAQDYERPLFLAGETQLEADLKAKGMQFIEDVDRAAFAAGGKQAVMAALAPELRPMYEQMVATK